MAPLAHTLALLAMAMATAAIEVVPLNMAWNSFDDQYLECSDNMTKKFQELQRSDFLKNDEFARNWAKAKAQWQEHGPSSYPPLTQDEVIALVAYTMKDTNLYKQFNDAVREAGSSSWKYRHQFHFKSLHFLLTRALRTLRRSGKCWEVSWELIGYQYEGRKGDKVRFGRFVLSSESQMGLQELGQVTILKVRTCYSVDIHKFSMYPSQKEVLIPPYETFKVTAVHKKGNTTHIEFRSIGAFSRYDCEWMKGDTMEKTTVGTNIVEKTIVGKTIVGATSWEDQGHAVPGGSLPRNSPHLGGLLLATVAMGVVTGTL